MSDNEPTTEAAKGSVTYTTLILAVIITAIVAAGSVLAVVYLPGDGDVLEQEGMFTRRMGEEGEVFFPHPYSSPPNVTLSFRDGTTLSDTFVVDVTTTSFKWKNESRDMYIRDTMWKAKGVKATHVGK